MKISIEIKDDKFLFEYQVGMSRHSSSSTITPELVCCFSDILRQMNHVTLRENKEYEKELNAHIWINENMEKARNFLKARGE